MTAVLWISAVFIALHSAIFGLALCCLGPFLKKEYVGSIIRDVPLDTVEQALCTALLLLACIPGSFFTGPLVQRYGNRTVLLGNCLIWIFGGFLCFFSNVYTFMLGRLVLGLATGCASVIPPVLLNEIATPESRGVISSLHQNFIVTMQLVAYIIIYFLVDVPQGWRWANSLAFIIFGVIAFIVGFWVPESPTWLLKNKREGECLDTLTKLRRGTISDFFNGIKTDLKNVAHNGISIPKMYRSSSNDNMGRHIDGDDLADMNSGSDQAAIAATHQVFYGSEEYDTTPDHRAIHANSAEGTEDDLRFTTKPSNLEDTGAVTVDDPIFVELQQLKNNSAGGKEAQWRDLIRPEYRFQLLLGFGLMALQSLIGINAVAMFATRLFSFAGLNDSEAMIGTIVLGLCGFVFSLLASVLLDRLGRRILILIGAISCTIFLILSSVSFLWMDGVSIQGTLSLTFTMLYIIGFNIGLGGPVWVILSELTSSNIRSKAQPLYCVVLWAFNFLIVFAALPCMSLFGGGDTDEQLKIGAGVLFLCFAVLGAMGIAFAWFGLVETAGKTEDQVQKELGGPGSDPIDLQPIEIESSSDV